MFKIIVLIFISLSCFAQEKQTSFYQIDLIIFTHEPASSFSSTSPPESLLFKGLPLQKNSRKTLKSYTLLSSSALQREYTILRHKPQYYVLIHSSWLQSSEDQKTVMLPKTSKDGWQVEGTIRVEKRHHYSLKMALVFSSLYTQNSALLTQTQQLKEREIYYFDHAQAGMLIKVHKLG